MITLDQYKKEIVSIYKYEIDNKEEKEQEREDTLNKIYSDEFLNRVIQDTYNLIKKLTEVSEDYYVVDATEDNEIYINLGLSGGIYSDKIYVDAYGNMYSAYILKKVLGNYFSIFVDYDEYHENNDDIVSVKYSFYIQMQNFKRNIDEVRESLSNDNKLK